MSEIVEGLGAEQRERIRELRAGGRFFWVDLCCESLSPADLGEALPIPSAALRPLLDFEHGERPSRRFLATRQEVVFPFHCYLEKDGGAGDGRSPGLQPMSVNVLVHGDFLLTVHREHASLPEILPEYHPKGAASNTSSTRSSMRWWQPPSTHSAKPSSPSRRCRSRPPPASAERGCEWARCERSTCG